MLTPAVRLSLERDLAPLLLPVADRGEGRAPTAGMVVPTVHDDRLAGRSEFEPFRDRQLTVGPTVVLAEGEEGTVRLEEIDGVLIVVEELDLQGHGVRFDVDESARRAVLGKRFGRTVQIDQERGD